jgi:dihydroorotate dehydrogenase
MSKLIGGVPMALPIMVGAGVCKYPRTTLEYMRPEVSVGAVVTGSYTPQERTGNTPEPLFWPPRAGTDFLFALNSYGMPNTGCDLAFMQLLHQKDKCVHPLVVNFAGFSVADYIRGQTMFGSKDFWHASAIEHNLGCPNTQEGKPLPMSYYLDDIGALLDALATTPSKCPVWLKLSPYLLDSDRDELAKFVDVTHVPTVKEGFAREVAGLIGRFPGVVSAVTLTNTVPNAIHRVDGKPVTGPAEGKAGLSGPLLRQIALRQTETFVDVLPESIHVIGAGGIIHGDNAVEFFDRGAKAVQCTTLPFLFGGAKSFAGLIEGSERLQEYLDNHYLIKE